MNGRDPDRRLEGGHGQHLARWHAHNWLGVAALADGDLLAVLKATRAGADRVDGANGVEFDIAD